jgi:hypothetical protein
LAFSINTKNQFWNTYDYTLNANGELEKKLTACKGSPKYIYYSGGLSLDLKEGANIALELGSSKVSIVKNQSLYDLLNTETINGVKRGEIRHAEIGFTLTTNFPPRKLAKNLTWENYANAFSPLKGIKTISAYTIDVNNSFEYILFKHIKLSYRTKINFDFESNPKPVIVNQFSVGAYLSNQMH